MTTPVNTQGAARLSDIVAFDIDLPEGWYPMPLRAEPSADAWPADFAERLASEPAAGARLREQLAALQLRLRSMGDPYLTAAVYIPAPESGQASCVLGFKALPLTEVGSPNEFQASLENDAAVQLPGRRVRDVLAWAGDTALGPLVGANNLIEHRNPGDAEGAIEERTIFGLYPVGAAQMVQFIFSTHDLAAFENMSQQTQDLVQTLQVTLGPPVELGPPAQLGEPA
ncbi:hypothetical protein D6T64_10460 [Cryobacterium melibiosiphilum]|uniref:Uncharacterized protein n=1 Tax=Cryobacterium melibiosiphilum TaxID=995039 RepID=A0A3A5MEH2_9MICO|nr:hypothetical protein [Cryobacterium melibiosiphilum]RJT88540.1 hypothetical protein D6T64_10460 [Cryobacterium melibiosiphilum]